MAETRTAHRLVQWVLRGGLAIASALVATGLAIAIASHEHAAATIRIDAVFGDAPTADRLVAAGLLLLALTPILRVVALVVIWAHEHDRRFALVGLAVLVVLGIAIATGQS